MHSNPYAQALKKKGNALFIPFVVLGDPDQRRSVEIVRLLAESGADALELGFPFSDPPADGPVIQAADTRALAAGIRMSDCFAMLTEIRTFTDMPIGLLVYYNLILQRGIEKFYADCSASGVTSVLIADLPLEHADQVLAIAKSHNIAQVCIISELTTDERLRKITAIAEGYLYVVSYLGVTGNEDAIRREKIQALLARARKYCELPLFAGFGINTTEQAAEVIAAGADGVIVGSRIVREQGNDDALKRICAEFQKQLAT